MFQTGYVTYANQAKRRLLGVKKSTLREFGAVSTQTAKEMASGALAAAKADVAVSITGIAGPDGGTARKPVGLVYIGCSVQGHTIRAGISIFPETVKKIRDNAVSAALTLTRRCILENCSKKGVIGDEEAPKSPLFLRLSASLRQSLRFCYASPCS